MMRAISSLLALAVAVRGHADFLMVDASYRTDSDGKMYCSRSLALGDQVMGKPLAKGSADFTFNVTAAGGDAATVKFGGKDITGYEFIFETASGVFEDGGCSGKRSAINGAKIAGYKSGSAVTVSFGKCGEPPFPCQIYQLSASA